MDRPQVLAREARDSLPRCACTVNGVPCNRPVKYAGQHICEEHAEEAFIRWPGDDQSVNTFAI